MSVSYIGLLQNDSVKFIGCMYYGDLKMVGVMLQLAYTSEEKIQALLNLGYIRHIGYNVESPKKFNDAQEAFQCYRNCLLHTKTSFTLSYIRDIHDNISANTARECKVSVFRYKPSYKYLYDTSQKCWLVYVDDSCAYKLQELLTDKNYFIEFKREVGSTDSWDDIKCVKECILRELSGKLDYNVISTYNEWLNSHKSPTCRNLEFGYAVRNGKKVFALLKRNANKSRRQVIEYSVCIGDLVQYLFNTHEVM